ncbi:MAG: ATP-binding protein [Geminicoccaceae bacterium]
MLELVLDADPSALAVMADAVEAFAAGAGVPPERAMQLVIALDEILTNIVTHGRLAPGDGIALRVEVAAGVLSAVVDDPGPPFDPLRDAPPPVLGGSVAERPIGGLGLHIAMTLARRIDYERRDGRNRLSLELPP